MSLLVVRAGVETLAVLGRCARAVKVEQALVAVTARHALLALLAQIGAQVLPALPSTRGPTLLVGHVGWAHSGCTC